MSMDSLSYLVERPERLLVIPGVPAQPMLLLLGTTTRRATGRASQLSSSAVDSSCGLVCMERLIVVLFLLHHLHDCMIVNIIGGA